eukprot:TRINITY_DN435_c0_g1_i4.p1 TRINITY_DN435_c0_g1~~TRINITY_DN435_c0_g1_i4.p1  ORF type:complete len:272 (+),score=59.92 TRINITY_DN435_c0_g1_i4:164-979(+)
MRSLFICVVASLLAVSCVNAYSIDDISNVTSIASAQLTQASNLCTNLITLATADIGLTNTNCTNAATALLSVKAGAPLSSINTTLVCGNCVRNLKKLIADLAMETNPACQLISFAMNSTLGYDTVNQKYCSDIKNTNFYNYFTINYFGGIVGQMNGYGTAYYIPLNASLGQCMGASICGYYDAVNIVSVLTGNSTLASIVGSTVLTKLVTECGVTMYSIQTCGPEPAYTAPTPSPSPTAAPTKKKDAISASASAVTLSAVAALLIAKRYIF